MKKFILGALLTLTTSLAFSDSYNASYDASYKGFSGSATLAFSQEGGHYTAELAMRPGLAWRVVISSIVDSVEGTFDNGHFKPTHYRRIKNGKSTMLDVAFAGENVTTIDDEGEKKTFSVSADGQDPLTQIVQIQYDLKHNQLKPVYHLVTDRNQRNYAATQQGAEVTLIEQGTKKPRRFVLSFADNGDTLIKMEKFKKGKSELTITKKP